MLVCLALGGLPAQAQESPEAGAAVATHITESRLDTKGEGPGRYLETYEWSDPRLPPLKRTVADLRWYSDEKRSVGLVMTRSGLEDEQGFWTGTAAGLQSLYAEPDGATLCVGGGAYEGLAAFIDCQPTGCEGSIIEGDAPVMPNESAVFEEATDAPPATVTTAPPGPGASGVTGWPTALELRRALSDIGWVWVADPDLVWTGGPPVEFGEPRRYVTLQELDIVSVEVGQGDKITGFNGSDLWVVPTDDWVLRLQLPLPMSEVYGWPATITSDWTLLGEVLDLLSIDGATRFQIRRTLSEPSTMPLEVSVPGGMVTIEAEQDPVRLGERLADVQFWRSTPIDVGPARTPVLK